MPKTLINYLKTSAGLKDIYVYWVVRRSALFDRDYYSRNNPNTTGGFMGPVWHYLRHGWREGRDPNEFFDTAWYLKRYCDVAESGINPFYHYLKYGWKENRDPSLKFSTRLYLSMNPDVEQSGENPLAHFLNNEQFERRADFISSFDQINESELLNSGDKAKDLDQSGPVYTLAAPLNDAKPDICSFAKAKNDKLIMTLWVRDEIDIIEYNIKFHLKQGVDFIIASDNGSKDGTREVLEKYEIKGVLRLLDDPRQDHSQALCVNMMGRMARDEYGADYVFHCDADEFWHPKSGDLKNEISASEKEALKATVINVLLLDKNGQETFPQDTRYAVVRPIIPFDYIEESKRVNLFFFRYLPSVIFKGYHEVSRGNHTVTDIPESEIGRSKDIIIYHYPLSNIAIVF